MSENILAAALNRRLLIFDGAMGTEIYRRHFFVNTSFENLVLSSPDTIRAIHQSYREAGADVLTTNSYNANRLQLAAFGLADKLEAICAAAVALARECADDTTLIAGSVGPAGEGATNLSRDERVALIAEPVRLLAEAGADFIIFESLVTPEDVATAVRAAAAVRIPYVLSLVPPASAMALDACVAAADNAPATAWGLNCGKGPEATLAAFEALRKKVTVPIVVQPNAGEPRRVDNRTMYMNSPEYFTTYALRYVNLGARGVGGCCGIGPEHIAEMRAAVAPLARSAAARLPEITAAVLPMPEIPLAERSPLGAKLQSGAWIKNIEITPPPGFDLTGVIAKARRCRAAGIDAINIPDGPRASSRISALITALEIRRQADIEVVMHCCCRDRSLIGLQSELLAAAAEQINSILFITGDPPKLGDFPFSTGVFDVDSIGMVKIQKHLNAGIELGGKSMKMQTRCAIGVGLDPNAIDLEREYRRICEKAEAGADFIVTQPVFAPETLLDFLKKIAHLHLPVIAGVWPLASLRNAEFMKNEVPGVIVPDHVMTRMAASSEREKQQQEGIAIAREAIAAIRHAVAGVQVSAPFGNVEIALAVHE